MDSITHLWFFRGISTNFSPFTRWRCQAAVLSAFFCCNFDAIFSYCDCDQWWICSKKSVFLILIFVKSRGNDCNWVFAKPRHWNQEVAGSAMAPIRVEGIRNMASIYMLCHVMFSLLAIKILQVKMNIQTPRYRYECSCIDRRKFCKHQGWHLTNMWPGLQEGSQRKKRCSFAVTLIIGIYVLLLHISLFNFCHANFIWFYDIVMKCCFCLIL